MQENNTMKVNEIYDVKGKDINGKTIPLGTMFFKCKNIQPDMFYEEEDVYQIQRYGPPYSDKPVELYDVKLRDVTVTLPSIDTTAQL